MHQHLWTEGLVAALARRTSAPRLERRGGGWILHLAGEPPLPLGGLPDDPARRAGSLSAQGVDMAIVALSSALGVEDLPADEAREIVEAWNDDAAVLPGRLGAWGAVALRDADPLDVDALLDRGLVGLCLPAHALATPDALDAVGPLLEALSRRGAPLFVHPGPASAGAWLPTLTDYVGGLSAAWLAWALHGRAAHPELRVCFAALGGLAPLQLERLAARGHAHHAALAAADPLLFHDTSSYGPLAIEAVVRALGPGSLVHGSDWPWAEPAEPSPLLSRPLLQDNPAALLRAPARPLVPV